MKDSLQEVSIKALNFNPMTLFSDEWLLITAGTKERGFNTMTACWGQTGAIWGHGKGLPTATVFVRPQRYTKEFIDREDYFTLSFFPKAYKKALAYLGTHSGRSEDKVAKTGLTPEFGNESTWFSEAKLVLVCRKIYHTPLLKDGFVDKNIMMDNYPERDFHEMYVGEITKVLTRTDDTTI